MSWVARSGSALLLLGLGGCAQTSARSEPSASLEPALVAAEAEFRSFPPPGAGVAGIARDRERFRSFGLERAGGAPVTERTVFQIASLTKPFTAIVVLRLAEQGRLGLDDRASKWLTWLPGAYEAVTIRQLLGHTSGVPRDLRRENVDEFSLEEFRRRFLAAEPSFPPGERWEYSNSGYTLLSLIAERASGRTFGRLLEELIFRPAGMRQTRYRAPLADRPGRAPGHDWLDGQWKPAPAVYSGFGNSGIESTSADLARFASALQRRRLLSARSYEQMLSPAVLGSGRNVEFPFRTGQASYGLGWFLTDVCGNRVAMHGGTIAGYSANLSWALQPRITAVALANGKSGPDRIGLADKIAAASLKSALECPR